MGIFRTVILLLLLSVTLTAQTVYNNDFSRFDNVGDAVLYLGFSPTMHSGDATNDSLFEDMSGNGYDFAVGGWTYVQLLDSVTTLYGNPFIENGSSLSFLGAHYLSKAGAAMYNPEDGDFTIAITWYIRASGDSRIFGRHFNNSYWAFETTRRPGWELRESSGAWNAYLNDNTQYKQLTGAASAGYAGGWLHIAVVVDETAETAKMYYNGVQVGSTLDITGLGTLANTTDAAYVGKGPLTNYGAGYIASFKMWDRVLTAQEVKADFSMPRGAVASQGNVTRNLDEWFLTAWSDTIAFPLSDATLGTNQEWKFTLSNKDTVTAWIGSRASAKSTVNIIPGGATFSGNTVYFGDGFSLSGDSLVIVFPADTASVDNYVLSKESISTATKKNFGKPFSNGFPKPFK